MRWRRVAYRPSICPPTPQPKKWWLPGVPEARDVGQQGGEAHTIALAEELHASEVLLDERAARALATTRGLRIIGSAGLLVRAKERGLIEAVQPYLKRMQAQGVRFSDRFLRTLLSQIGEGSSLD